MGRQCCIDKLVVGNFGKFRNFKPGVIVLRLGALGGERVKARPLELIGKSLTSWLFKIPICDFQAGSENENFVSGWRRRLEGEGARTHVGQMACGVIMIIFIVGMIIRVTILAARRSLHLARCGCGRATSIAVLVVGDGVGAVVASPRRGGLRSGAQLVVHAAVRPSDDFNKQAHRTAQRRAAASGHK